MSIIYQTLLHLFPINGTNWEAIDQFTPKGFIEQILIPETAMWLIQDDCKCTAAQAVSVLHDSSEYGAIMFQLDDEN